MAEPNSSDMPGQPRFTPDSSDSADPALPLGEAEFAEAVRAALRHYLRTDLLRDNPLLRSRLVASALREAGPPLAPVQALKDLLRTHCERIGDAPKLAALRRVLELTWLTPMRSQQVVAESLHLSWSTYRRRLADAMQLLVAQLWEAECALARPLEERGEAPIANAIVTGPAGPAASSGADAQSPLPSRVPAANPRRRGRRWLAMACVAVIGIALVAAAIGWQRRGAASARPHAAAAPAASTPAVDTVTLAVLPFLDMDADPAQQYLSDGITEELINRLGRSPNLRVAARTSAFVFRDKTVDVRQAARALGVANVLEGSVQHSGERLRVRVALVSARDGYELWSTEYEPAASDLLNVEDEIAEAVLRELQPRLSAKALADLHVGARLDPAAHDYYLVGLQYLNRRTSADIGQALAYFRRAIQADPDYAPAWNGSATAYAIWRDYSDAPPDSHYEEALAAARRAATLEPKLARPHAVLGLLYQEHWQWRAAEREFKLALQLDPSDSAAHQWYAMYWWFRGDMRAALLQMKMARELDPLSPIINTDLARALLYTGDVDGAVTQARAAIALEPRFSLAHAFLAGALNTKGLRDQAIAETRIAIALTPAPHPSSYLGFLAQLQWQAGQHAAVREQVSALEARAKRRYVSGVALAFPEWELGEKDRAFANLFRAAAEHDHLLMMVSGFRNEEWCSDPRFTMLMKKMGLPPPP